jgi:hypothetical protein
MRDKMKSPDPLPAFRGIEPPVCFPLPALPRNRGMVCRVNPVNPGDDAG